MTIINNRRKICSEVPSDKYKDNFDAIFGKKEDKQKEERDKSFSPREQKEDKDGNT